MRLLVMVITMNFNVSLVGVGVAAVVNMILGALWYSPVLFCSVWMKLSKIKATKEDMKKCAKVGYAVTMVMSLVMAFVLSVLVSSLGLTSALGGALVGALVWVGFVMTTFIGQVLWEGKPFLLYVLNSGYYLVSFVIMGAIVSSF